VGRRRARPGAAHAREPTGVFDVHAIRPPGGSRNGRRLGGAPRVDRRGRRRQRDCDRLGRLSSLPEGRRRPPPRARHPPARPVLVRGLGLRCSLRLAHRTSLSLVCARRSKGRRRPAISGRRAGGARARSPADPERNGSPALVRDEHRRRRGDRHRHRALRMILAALILIPLAGGLLAWALGRCGSAPRWICVGALVLDLILAVATLVPRAGGWTAQLDRAWIPELGIRVHLAVDGVSLLMVLLTLLLGIVSVLASWTEITERVGFFHLNLMGSLVGVLGVFLTLDLFLFAFFWELMLVPMYFLIGIWGHERRTYAAIKFFIFTQLSGLLMLLAILGLWWVHHAATGIYTFDYF